MWSYKVNLLTCSLTNRIVTCFALLPLSCDLVQYCRRAGGKLDHGFKIGRCSKNVHVLSGTLLLIQ